MSTLTMLDRSQAPPSTTAVKALAMASKAAGTPGPGAWAFYLGGPGHNGGRGSTYTNALLDALQKKGVKLLPIYVGRQRNLSRARGIADAQDAMRLNREFGSRNTMIAADIEGHTSEKNPAAAVEYVNGWTETLHAAGLRSMVYGSFQLGADLGKHASPQPDAVWIARYRAHQPERQRDPHNIPGIPAQAFAKAGQRAWQYAAEFKDHPTDKKATRCDIEGINVDVSAIDAEVFGTAPIATSAAVPPPVIPTQPTARRATRTHVIQAGETLTGLERRLQLKRGSLFAANQKVLDAAARKHGKADSAHGNLIFPGVVITLPH
jgi:hypothetical protein